MSRGHKVVQLNTISQTKMYGKAKPMGSSWGNPCPYNQKVEKSDLLDDQWNGIYNRKRCCLHTSGGFVLESHGEPTERPRQPNLPSLGKLRHLYDGVDCDERPMFGYKGGAKGT